jgi:adenosylmethionine-8-amino-7-oxononanoate aminotransferase
MDTRSRSGFFPRSFAKQYPLAVRGNGVSVWDSKDNRYLDFSSSAVVSFIGHGDREVLDAIQQQLADLEFVHTTQFLTQAALDLADSVLEFAGPAFAGGAVFFTSGGSEAIESALKLARQYQVESGNPKRYRILSRHQAYHGSTFGAMTVSGNRRRREMYQPMLREDEKVNTPYCYRCAYECKNCSQRYAQEVAVAIDKMMGEAAAFIFEPISGATLGAAVPPADYLSRVAENCRENHVLLIADEVMTGFGRTGRNFAVDHWSVTPDIIVAGKGVSSGYAPLGAVIANQKVVDGIANGSGTLIHGFTYNAHPLGMAAGKAVLFKTRRLMNSVAETSGKLKSALESLRGFRSVGDVRGIGLLHAVEFVADKNSKAPFPPGHNLSARVGSAAAKRGVLVYPMQGCVDGIAGDHILIAPPAVITPDEIKWAVTQLGDAIEEVEPTT